MKNRPYSSYLKEKYGCKVYKIGIDAGFSCPNRDGTKGIGGCSYCNGRGSRAPYADSALSVKEQIVGRIEYLKEKGGRRKFIAYFQAFSNTYAPVEKLKAIYDEILPFEDIVGISIGTRPDTVDREKIARIASYSDRYEVWIEYGLQSIHDRTLRAINRGHEYKDFLSAVEMTKGRGIKICAHVILGLPGESHDDMMATAKELRRLEIDGVKIHLFHILKGSALEDEYRRGKVALLAQDEYANLVCDFLELLSPDTIIQRLTGEGSKDDHIAPEWALDKLGTIKKIKEGPRRKLFRH